MEAGFSMALNVQDRDPKMRVMEAEWPLLTALLGGTRTMRAASTTFLPRQPKEDQEDYNYRLAVATLFPAFERTCTVMAGKPFAKEVTLSKDTPDVILDLCNNIDGEGRSLHAFASDVFDHSAIKYGFGGILVDFTRTQGRARTRAEEKAIGARPYCVHIKAEQILGWMVGEVGGKPGLTMLRIAETKEVPDGDYGTKLLKRVRVLRPGSFEVWEESANGSYALVREESGATTLSFIPFVPVYGRRAAFMQGMPPLLNLAYLNVKHWQNESDQDDSARFARKRLLVFSGINNKDEIVMAASQAVNLPAGGSADVLQGSAESVTVGRSELNALEEQMIQTGAELLVAQPGQRTATEASNDAEANKSALQSIVENYEDALDLVLDYMAAWLGIDRTAKVTLFKDFAAQSLTEAGAQMIVNLFQAGLLSKETAIKEMQRRGVLSPDLDAEAEFDRIASEGPALGTIGGE